MCKRLDLSAVGRWDSASAPKSDPALGRLEEEEVLNWVRSSLNNSSIRFDDTEISRSEMRAAKRQTSTMPPSESSRRGGSNEYRLAYTAALDVAENS